MPGSSKKPLYLAKNIGELNKLSEAIPKLTDARKALLSAEKLYKSAHECVIFGDEEKAYVLYMRFFNVVKVIKKTPDYKKNEKYFNDLIGRKTCEMAITSAEKLAESLNDRYDEGEAKKVSEKFEITRSGEGKKKKDEEEEEKLRKQKEEEERILKEEEEEKKKASMTPGVIGVRQMYDLLLDANTSLLILDVRSREHFYSSHIKVGSCVNVPFNIVPPGSTVTSIEKSLSDEAKGEWIKRGHVDHIILIDWRSSIQCLEKGTAVSSLKDAIFKWDSTTIVRSEPLVLDGGYENWLLHYPTMTTNANVEPPANDLFLDTVPSLDDIEYDLDFLSPRSPARQNGVSTNGDVPLNNQADLWKTNTIDRNNLKDVGIVDKNPLNDKDKVDNRILSETRGDKVKNTNVISQGGRQPPQINRAIKPQSMSNSVTERQNSKTVTEDEWNAIHQAKEIKQVELDRYERETKRLVAEQKARRAKLQDEERQLEKLAVMKKAELKETAHLMREKRKIQLELDVMKQDQAERVEEERKRQDELSKLKDEEEDKLSRLKEVERLRAMRKIKESEERTRKQEAEQRAVDAMEMAKMERENAEKRLLAQNKSDERELAELRRLEEEENRKKKAEAERLRVEKEVQDRARRDAEAEAEKEKALKEAAAAASAAAAARAKLNDVTKSDASGAPASSVNHNLPPGWKKVLEPTTGRYGYIDLNTGYLHWQPPIPDSPAKTVKGNQTYTTKLKDEESASSGQGGMKRSHSSPNIAKMVEEEKTVVPEKPLVPRTVKPAPAPAPVQVPQFIKVTEVSAAKVRNLKPAWGSVMPGLTGLHNMGNTCYMNSTIQCLSNTSFLTAYFLHDKYRLDINRENFLGSKGEITEEFAVLVKALWSGQYRSITPCDFKETIARFNPTFAGYEQQDSQELLLFLMDGLHEDLNRIRKRPKLPEMDTNNLPDNSAAEKTWMMHKKINDSIIVDLFQGLLKSTITCLTCRSSSSKFDAFMYLSLPIPSSSRCTLRDCLKHFSKTEEMSGESRWNCPNCKCKRNAEKRIVIWKLPPVLLIHLKRFYYKGIWRQKITTFVDFPLDGLNLNEHVAGPICKGSFKLYGVSNHYGTMEGGHYTAYCKHPANSSWFKYDDKEVNKMDPSDVKTSAAYTLFYTSLHQELRLQ